VLCPLYCLSGVRIGEKKYLNPKRKSRPGIGIDGRVVSCLDIGEEDRDRTGHWYQVATFARLLYEHIL